MISGIAIALMLVLFAGLAGWAYSSRREHDFNDAAQLALEDRTQVAPQESQP